MPLIECNGVTRTFVKGTTEIRPLDDLDLTVERGDYLALMGPSGSGKTTLLNMLSGIDQPTSGSIVIDGVDITKLSRNELAEWRSRNIGYVFQLYHLVPVLTAYENVELPLLLRKDLDRKARHQRVVLALDLVGLSDRHDHFPNQLSGGQEQRVAIARAIVTDPPILVCDEPTGDLDGVSANAILDLLARLHEDLGKTLVMVTHDPNAAARAAETIHLEKGRIAGRTQRTEALPAGDA